MLKTEELKTWLLGFKHKITSAFLYEPTRHYGELELDVLHLVVVGEFPFIDILEHLERFRELTRQVVDCNLYSVEEWENLKNSPSGRDGLVAEVTRILI